ncbi:MAG: hypothetical protein KF894_11475 [Labilithrix sp.]|nr:hypothetical protein [Labilithrix sp.]
MKEPQRLIRNGSPQAKALLSALDEDVPPDLAAGQERVLRALRSGTAPVSQPRGGATRRWLVLASLGGVLLASATAYEVSRRDAGATRHDASEARLGSPPSEVLPASASSAEGPEPSSPHVGPQAAPRESVDVHALVTAAPEERAAPGAARPAVSVARRDVREAAPPSKPDAPAQVDGADELDLLERAQLASSQGHPDDALALVARHRSAFPRGRFSIEMGVVEIEALARAGRTEEARARGARFLERHPGSPYTRRVEAVVRPQNHEGLAR